MATLVFVLGTWRCGSTVVQELLARHPQVGFISNVDAALPVLDLKGRWNPAIYRHVPAAAGRRDRGYLRRLHPSLAERIHFGPSEAYRLLRSKVSPIVAEPVRDLTERDAMPWLADRFRSFFEERIEASQTDVFMHKLTGWPRARFISAVFPEARFVHVVRDGRAVAASLIQRPWWKGHLGPDGWGFGPLSDEDAEAWERSGRDFAVLAGLEWKRLMAAFDESRAAIGGERWLDLRFEEVVAEPRESMQRALRFCGLPWGDEFEQAFRAYPMVPGHLDRYRGDLGARSAEALDEVLGPTLTRYDYPASKPSSPPQVASSAGATTS